MSRRFAVVTTDTSGLGWTKKLAEEGETASFVKAPSPKDTEDELAAFWKVGAGLTDVQPLDKETVDALSGPDTLWVFDRNILPDFADRLRQDGQKVFGGQALSDKMENDRAFACEVATKSGLPSPPTQAFETIADGVAFLEANPDKAFVLKPNAAVDSSSTFVPFREDDRDANEECLVYLRNMPQEMAEGYILQERVPGVEANCEVWVVEGEPFMAFACLENKRKGEGDGGDMSGCAGDVVFPIPVDSPLVRATVGKMLPFYREQKYTGFADVNVIIGDNRCWFLEVCNRFGYNSHATLFLGSCLDGMGNVLWDFSTARTAADVASMPARFRQGFSASVTCFVEKQRPGVPLHLAPRWESQWFPFDGQRVGEDVLLTGYGNEVGAFVDHDYTIEDAAESALTRLRFNEAVSYPGMFYRHDLHKTDYRGAPVKRYSALRSMGLVK